MTYELYIHVPFCLRRCGYCDFNTYTAPNLGEGASRSNYATMLIREMRLVKAWQLRHGVDEPAMATMFFGGGTPTVLAADDLIRMKNAAAEIWGLLPGAEITTEANPDTVNPWYLNRLKSGGFTRVSFGMQSAVPRILHTLERTHTPANVAANVAAARRAGLECSVDLIYGTPGESLADWRTSVQAAIDLGVDHISAYALTLAPRTPMGRRVARGTLSAPDDDDEAAKYQLADALFSEAGLRWYEISNWARPGHESRHNLGYWRNVDWAGLGPGAPSHYNDVHGPFGELRERSGAPGCLGGQAVSTGPAAAALRAWDIAHPRLWARTVSAGKVPWAGHELINPGQQVEEDVMLGLRLHEGLDLRALRERTGFAPDHRTLTRLDREGLVRMVGGHVIPTLRGRLLNDAVIEALVDPLA